MRTASIRKDTLIDLQPSSVLRAGAIGGFLYTAVIIATTLYVESQPLPPTKNTYTSAQNDRLLLAWVHQHASLMDVYTLSALAGFALLGCVAFAIFTMLRQPGLRMPLVGVIMALAGLGLSLAASVLERVNYVHYAQQYADTHTASVVSSIVKSFENAASRDYAIDTSGRFAVVIWIGMVGLSLTSMYGWRSAPVLGSFATFVVGVFGFTPVFALWSAGAGFGLWRVAASGVPQRPIGDERWTPQAGSEELQRGRLTRRWSKDAGVVEAEATLVEDAPAPEANDERDPEPEPAQALARPPRGTAVPRRIPPHARGSKSSQPRKRR